MILNQIETADMKVTDISLNEKILIITFHEIYNKAKAGTLVGTQQYSPDLVALLEENKKLKQQLKVAEMEREFLKKAAAYFAKENQ